LDDGYEARSYDPAQQTDKAPDFQHPEIWDLYEYGLDIPPEKLEAILALPRASLIEDLKKVLKDLVFRYEYFHNQLEIEGAVYDQRKHEMPFHALSLLCQLKAKEALPEIFYLLEQGSELLDFWFADGITEEVWRFLYELTQDDLALLQEFSHRPGLDTYVRTLCNQVIEAILHHQPERSPECARWYHEQLDFFWDHKDDNTLFDPDYMNFLSVEGIRLPEFDEALFKKSERIFHTGFEDYMILGSHEEFTKDWKKERKPRKDSDGYLWLFKDIFTFYDKYMETWDYEKMVERGKNQNEDDKDLENLDVWSENFKPKNPAPPKNFIYDGGGTFQREGRKIGRNDPCPCGSGKKYKKCCMNK
jgi:hypothetical protein